MSAPQPPKPHDPRQDNSVDPEELSGELTELLEQPVEDLEGEVELLDAVHDRLNQVLKEGRA